MTSSPELERLILQIRAGHIDHDQVVTLAKAVGAAIADHEIALRWVIELPDGFTHRAGDTKVSEAVAIEKALGCDWSFVHPGRNAGQLSEVLAVLFRTRLGLSEEQAREKLDGYTMEQLEGVVDVYAATPTKAATATE